MHNKQTIHTGVYICTVPDIYTLKKNKRSHGYPLPYLFVIGQAHRLKLHEPINEGLDRSAITEKTTLMYISFQRQDISEERATLQQASKHAAGVSKARPTANL